MSKTLTGKIWEFLEELYFSDDNIAIENLIESMYINIDHLESMKYDQQEIKE